MVAPTTISSLCKWVNSNSNVQISCESPYDILEKGATLSLENLNQIEEWRLEDQLIKVQSGIKLSDLNKKLQAEGFEIPIGLNEADQNASLASFLSINLPHWNMQAGTWRDWITAIRFVSADGRIIRSGADVVKSVTGFDLHKLIIGSRFTLGIPVSVTIAVRPFQNKPTYPPIHADLPEGCQLIVADPSYLKTLPPSTIQHLNLESKLALVQWTGDNHKGSVWTSNHGTFNLPTFPSPIATLMQKLKEEFDPHHKLNPGGMGIF